MKLLRLLPTLPGQVTALSAEVFHRSFLSAILCSGRPDKRPSVRLVEIIPNTSFFCIMAALAILRCLPVAYARHPVEVSASGVRASEEAHP